MLIFGACPQKASLAIDERAWLAIDARLEHMSSCVQIVVLVL